MDLILWRHADAEEGSPDDTRALTDKGRQQAASMAGWLKSRLPKDVRILVSPARRAQQTAQELGIAYETCKALAPASDATEALAASGWPNAQGVVLVVGHQPMLGQIAALLLSGSSADWAIKKSGVWWLSNRVREGESQIMLEAALAPDMLKIGKP
jgi:phosphohistidine phosphatase